MATSLTVNSNYEGESAGKYIASALLSANTIENGGLTVMPSIKYKSTMKIFTGSDFIKDADCDFDPTGTMTLDDRVIEPKELQINSVICKKTLRSDWDAVSMGYSAYDTLPPNFAEFIIARMLGYVAEATETSIWQGDGTVNGEFEGFNSIVADAITATAIPAGQIVTGTTIDATNVIAELGKVVDAIPSRLYGKEGLKLYVPNNVAKAYVRALGGFGSAGYGANGTNAQGTQWFTQGSGLSFDGIPMFVCNGQADNKIIAAVTDNLFFGTGVMNDMNEVKLIDTSDILGDANVRFVMRYTAGTQVGVLEDLVVYGF